MSLRVGIMGFGRIGRNLFRQAAQRDDLDIVAISDLGAPEAMAYLFEFDTIYGHFDGKVRLDGKYLCAGRQRARLLKGVAPEDMPWDAYNVDVVVDSTGAYRERAPARRSPALGRPPRRAEHAGPGRHRPHHRARRQRQYPAPRGPHRLLREHDHARPGPHAQGARRSRGRSAGADDQCPRLLQRSEALGYDHAQPAPQPQRGPESDPQLDLVARRRRDDDAPPQGQDRRHGGERARAQRLQPRSQHAARPEPGQGGRQRHRAQGVRRARSAAISSTATSRSSPAT